MRERLQKLLAAGGVASRRKAEALIRDGRVTVNGRTASLGESADPERDRIALDGEPVRAERHAYWVIHKPRGVITTRSDSEGRRTVLDLLPRQTLEALRLFPVGRLDMGSEGLLLLTNDGAVAHALLHPSLGTEREYRVIVRGSVSPATVRRLGRGVRLSEGGVSRLQVTALEPVRGKDATRLDLVLGEGRKHQIRLTLGAVGHPVQRLVRRRIGPLRLGRLAAGEARPLTPRELSALLQHAEQRLPGSGKPRAGSAAKVAPKPGKARPKASKPLRGKRRSS